MGDKAQVEEIGVNTLPMWLCSSIAQICGILIQI